jgi:hypothetical protein
MAEMEDFDLLAAYSGRGSEAAFATRSARRRSGVGWHADGLSFWTRLVLAKQLEGEWIALSSEKLLERGLKERLLWSRHGE